MITENLKRILCFILYIFGIVTTFMGLITLYTTGFYIENVEMIVIGSAVSVIGILLICCGTLIEDRIYEGDKTHMELPIDEKYITDTFKTYVGERDV